MARASSRPKISAAELREKVTIMLVAGMSVGQAEDAAVVKLGATKKAAAAAVGVVSKRIALAGHVDLRRELGMAISRYQDLYKRAISAGELKIAATAQGKLDRLLALHDVPTMGPAEGDEVGESESERELAAIRDHVVPLGLVDDEDYPLVELVRLMADRVRRSMVEDGGGDE